jgi:hypothetical protein
MNFTLYRNVFYILALAFHGQVFGGEAQITQVEGAAEAQLPGSTEYITLEGMERLPTGSTIRTYDDSSVIFRGVEGSMIRVEENSDMVIGEISQEGSASKPVLQKTRLDLYEGKLTYIFNQFPDENKEIPDSYFRVLTPVGVAAARGGSGFVDSEGNNGAMSGRLAVLSRQGEVLRVQAGQGIQVAGKGSLRRIEKITDLPLGRRLAESVLQLGQLGQKRGLLDAVEMDLAGATARRMGFNEQQIQWTKTGFRKNVRRGWSVCRISSKKIHGPRVCAERWFK